MPRVPATILGGLPVVADVAFGYDSYAGEYYAEVDMIYWRKKDGTAGKQIPQHIRDRAETFDSYFSDLIERANEYLAHEADDGVDVEPFQLQP